MRLDDVAHHDALRGKQLPRSDGRGLVHQTRHGQLLFFQYLVQTIPFDQLEPVPTHQGFDKLILVRHAPRRRLPLSLKRKHRHPEPLVQLEGFRHPPDDGRRLKGLVPRGVLGLDGDGVLPFFQGGQVIEKNALAFLAQNRPVVDQKLQNGVAVHGPTRNIDLVQVNGLPFGPVFQLDHGSVFVFGAEERQEAVRGKGGRQPGGVPARGDFFQIGRGLVSQTVRDLQLGGTVPRRRRFGEQNLGPRIKRQRASAQFDGRHPGRVVHRSGHRPVASGPRHRFDADQGAVPVHTEHDLPLGGPVQEIFGRDPHDVLPAIQRKRFVEGHPLPGPLHEHGLAVDGHRRHEMVVLGRTGQSDGVVPGPDGTISHVQRQDRRFGIPDRPPQRRPADPVQVKLRLGRRVLRQGFFQFLSGRLQIAGQIVDHAHLPMGKVIDEMHAVGAGHPLVLAPLAGRLGQIRQGFVVEPAFGE